MEHEGHKQPAGFLKIFLKSDAEGHMFFLPWGPLGDRYKINHQEQKELEKLLTMSLLRTVAVLSIGVVFLQQIAHFWLADVVYVVLTCITAITFYHARTLPVRDSTSLVQDEPPPSSATAESSIMILFYWFLIGMGVVAMLTFMMSHQWIELVIALTIGSFCAYLSQKLASK